MKIPDVGTARYKPRSSLFEPPHKAAKGEGTMSSIPAEESFMCKEYDDVIGFVACCRSIVLYHCFLNIFQIFFDFLRNQLDQLYPFYNFGNA